MATVSAQELERILGFVGELHSVDDSEPYSSELLDHMKQVLPCDGITFCELDHSRLVLTAEVATSGEPVGDDPTPEEFDSCWRNPLSEYRRRTGDRGPIKFSDFF